VTAIGPYGSVCCNAEPSILDLLQLLPRSRTDSGYTEDELSTGLLASSGNAVHRPRMSATFRLHLDVAIPTAVYALHRPN
jgi:hypothetical protein